MCIVNKSFKMSEIDSDDNLNVPIDKKNEINVNSDILKKSVDFTKVLLYYRMKILEKCQQSIYYKKFTKFTQPAHVITFVSAIMLASILNSSEESDKLPSPIFKLIYLGSFAAHFGIQIWMTFVSGIVLYLTLPRHTFGQVQEILFPKYFMLNAVLSLITLCTFLQHHSNIWITSSSLQIMVLAICFCVELTIRLYISPILLNLLSKKNMIESTVGVGTEVGRNEFGTLTNSPVYMKLHSSFRKVHMIIAVGNIITIGCTGLHLHYLSSKINI